MGRRAKREQGNFKSMMRNNLVERRNEAKIIRRIVSIMALLIILAVGSVTFFSYKYIHTALQPVDPNSDEQIELDIPIGSSTSAIGNLLEENGIIHNATVFKYFVKFNNYAGFQAGNYTMSPAMTLDEISQTLQTGRLVREALFKITIPEGLNLNQIAGILSILWRFPDLRRSPLPHEANRNTVHFPSAAGLFRKPCRRCANRIF